MQPANYLPKVKEQYEHFPYPPRHPQDEMQMLVSCYNDCLDALNHYCFGGRRNFHKNFRMLTAGAGTGDTVIFMAEQLRGTQAEIIYLDLSQTSMNICQERAKIRGLTNITWVNASLLDIPKLGLGKFDYINCTGVLHHLADPVAGLAALEGALAEGGALGLMVYGQYGRTAIYQMQEIMRLLASDEDNNTKLDLCRRVMNRLPKTNWLAHCYEWFGDLNKGGDAGLYDLLLHSQDRAYSVPQLYDYVESVGLKLVTFVGYNKCDPALYITDNALLEHIKTIPLREQYAIGELLVGSARIHTIYAMREIIPPPAADDLDMVPSLTVSSDPALYQQLRALAEKSDQTLHFNAQDCTVRLPVSPALAAVVRQIDGKTTLGNIYHKAAQAGNHVQRELQWAFKDLYQAMSATQFMFLRHKDVPPYLTVKEMQDAFLQRVK